MRRREWTALTALLTITLIYFFSPLSGTRASTPPVAAPETSPVDEGATASRRQLTDTDQQSAKLEQLLAAQERIAPLVPPQHRLMVVEIAEQHDLDPLLVAAVGHVESRWEPETVGSAGEIGVMQIMPTTAAWIAREMGLTDYDLTDPETNVAMGTWYLAQLTEEQGSVEHALAAYNAGPAWRDRAPLAARSYVDRIRAAASASH